MLASLLKCLLCSLAFLLASDLLGTKTDALSGDGPVLSNRPDPFDKLGISSILSVPQGVVQPPVLQVSLPRQKRNVLFPSGVKLCGQESVPQAITNHLNYFHLRVCQETVWEAYKIFWDRLPNQEEYQTWMSQCLEGTITALEMGKNFSQSKEHLALIERRMSRMGFKSELNNPWNHMCSLPTPGTNREVQGEPTNDIEMEVLAPPMRVRSEQVVDLNIFLKGERYSEALRDPASLQYQTLNQQFTDKIQDALGGLPGFKGVAVQEFRLQKDAQGVEGVVVVYSVTVEVAEEGVSTEQLGYLHLQSNRVETSYREVEERPTVTDFRNHITETLHKDNVLNDTVPVSRVAESTKPTAGTPDDGVEDILSSEMPPDAPKVESEDVMMGENDVIILEESVSLSPDPKRTIDDTGLQEEGLLLENIVADPASPDHLGDATLPKPPNGVESSGSGVEIPDNLPFQPEKEAPEEIIIQEAGADVSGVEEESVKVPELQEEVAEVSVTAEVIEKETQSTKDLESSIVKTETMEEVKDDVPVETAEIPVSTGNPHAIETLTPDQPEEGANVILAFPELAEDGDEVGSLEEGPIIEEPVAEEETLKDKEADQVLDITGVSEEDLLEEEVLLVHEAKVETVEPTPPSAEKESPFTRVSVPTPPSAEKESPFTRVSVDVIVEEKEASPPGPEAKDQDVTSALVPAEIHPGPDISITLELQTIDPVTDYDSVQLGGNNQTEEGSSEYPSGVGHGSDQSIAMPTNPRRALMVFFSLRVTNMMFSEDLFNKSSPEYKALEQRFLELLVPYLQSNLSNFKNLEILNFRNGSIVVNSRMRFGKPVPRSVNSVVYLILEDLANTAYQTMNLAIDKFSLDVESGDQANPCKFQACNEFAQCLVNQWSGEAECVCDAGFFSVDGLPCQSICDLQADFCLNDGKCDIIPGQGAICRCRVGENWWYRGEHCEEYVSEPLVVGIAIASVAGFLLVASAVIFFLARTLRDQYDKDEAEDPIRRGESIPSLERATKYNPMFESEATTAYSHYYRRYPEAPVYSSASAEASTDFSSEEIRHIYENSELTKEEIQDRIRIIELYAKDRQFADFVRHHQTTLETRTESVST
ncbi:interphotoreceptor matrix proteoglycan 2 isoform X1 [Esox lucius]|uniref:Interphotoreceptor matrix proteoglycan 2 n=3 Tax=Esox lucius TaxID=8010 RepID=A0A3P9AER7_ESOLU|nr:interphotoreceptor matrix proteoglycan 2 isoform X1 [Esox lucius]XP_028969320.2 interphotoreceptor matrix proteoglycan 2 isoform X1 [Esox lucius]XP_034142625.1 interphotoreceptor matrix proteoglycan 2 isoform X1 [Esox lucius]